MIARRDEPNLLVAPGAPAYVGGIVGGILDPGRSFTRTIDMAESVPASGPAIPIAEFDTEMTTTRRLSRACSQRKGGVEATREVVRRSPWP